MVAPFEELQPDWLSVEAAIGALLRDARPLTAVHLPPLDALGRILASDVVARAELPPHDNAAMDGYAVRGAEIEGASAEAPRRLKMVASVTPGAPLARTLGRGEAIRITTGAPVPSGADSVVRVEDTDREAESGRVVITLDRDAGRNIRPAGRDLRAGEVVAAAGRRLDPGGVAISVAAGAATVAVHPRPRVTIVTTGDELAGPEAFDRVVAGEAIPDTNGPMIAAAVREAGGLPDLGPAVPDAIEALVERLDAARE
ncbi:MAG: hypothetical protein RQ745_13985, partial [Longimicrobiales bacterium]|nr:hypothetical protein [Longimicrobiales bacterium]